MKKMYLLALVPFAAMAGGNPHTPPQSPSTNSASSSSSADALALGVGVGIGEGGDGGNAYATGGKGGSASSNAVGIGQGGNAVSGSVSKGGDAASLSSARQGQAQQQALTNANKLGNDSSNLNANDNAASASNDGNSLSTSYANKTTALALGLASVTGAQVDPSICRKGQTAGWRVTLIERTGRNKYDQDCLAKTLDEQLKQDDFARCMDIANAYLKIGVESAYMQQLAKCGGTVEKALIGYELNARKPAASQLIPPDAVTKDYVNEVVNRAFKSTQHK